MISANRNFFILLSRLPELTELTSRFFIESGAACSRRDPSFPCRIRNIYQSYSLHEAAYMHLLKI